MCFIMVNRPKGKTELGVDGPDVLASLALQSRTFSPGLVTPLGLVVFTIPYFKKGKYQIVLRT